MTTAIEVVTFKLKSDVSIEQFEQSQEGVNSFCKTQAGFIYRSLSKDDQGTWFDIVYWTDIDSAKSAGEAFMRDEKCQELSKLIDNTSVVMRHMSASTEMMGDSAS
jgi:hypothetical protein